MKQYTTNYFDTFSKGQPCMRSSALVKRYGWGVHSDKEGKIAIYKMGSYDYKHLSSAENIKHIKGIRSSKK